jgi:hypothetical protein
MLRWLPIALTVVAVAPACAEPSDPAAQGSSTGVVADDDGTTTSGGESSSDTTGVPTTTGMAADSSSTTAATTEEGAVFDVGVMPDVPVMECVQCEIALMTTQSNAMHATVGMPLFLEAQLDGHLVFGLAEADAGRVAFSGDGNVVYREGTCPLWPWLGATGEELPRVLCFGAEWPCNGLTDSALEINALHTYAGVLDYGGLTLPDEYAADPVALRDDYDLVVYISVHDFATGSWDFALGDAATLETFVRDEGGGLYLVGEYWGAMATEHLESLNWIAAPYDLEFEELSLDWGPAGAMVEIDCFPDPEG